MTVSSMNATLSKMILTNETNMLHCFVNGRTQYSKSSMKWMNKSEKERMGSIQLTVADISTEP